MRKISRRVSNKLWFFASLALLGLTSPAAAFIPPPIAVKVISPDLETEARAAALVEILAHFENFQWSSSYVGRGRAVDCLSESDADECLRNLIRDASASNRPPAVLVIARKIGESDVELRCLGSGKISPKPERQLVTLDLKESFFGVAAARQELRKQALSCIWSAAAEDNSGIK